MQTGRGCRFARGYNYKTWLGVMANLHGRGAENGCMAHFVLGLVGFHINITLLSTR